MASGYIYIMTNPSLKDMVKIGYAANVEERRKQLSTTALPYDYEVYATYETPGNLEAKKLHKLIDNLNPD
ncbi:MAG: GIY-YIG nuclease family protein [Clostridia bacterium]|nr:GIY-YIG nuclease family protein [Clostridia bacterium]